MIAIIFNCVSGETNDQRLIQLLLRMLELLIDIRLFCLDLYDENTSKDETQKPKIIINSSKLFLDMMHKSKEFPQSAAPI